MKVFQSKRAAFDMAEQRKATDASGKGIEDNGGGLSNYKPKMPGNRKGPGARGSVGGAAAASGSAKKPPGAIPKWKL